MRALQRDILRLELSIQNEQRHIKNQWDTIKKQARRSLSSPLVLAGAFLTGFFLVRKTNKTSLLKSFHKHWFNIPPSAASAKLSQLIPLAISLGSKLFKK